jgi:hypothetical protein
MICFTVMPFAEKSSRFLARLLAVGLLLLGLVSASHADLETGLVACYPFDGNASDMSGNGNGGTIYGAISGVDRHDEIGRAYTFDGVNDYIQSSSATVSGTAYTITAWIKMNQSSNGPIVTLGYGGNLLKNLAFFAEPGQRLHIGTPRANGVSGSSVNISVGEWSQTIVISGDYEQNQTFFYANGIKYSATTKSGANYPFPLNNSPASIGKYVNTANAITFFDGSIDEVRIYDRALSAVTAAGCIFTGSIKAPGSFTIIRPSAGSQPRTGNEKRKSEPLFSSTQTGKTDRGATWTSFDFDLSNNKNPGIT